MTRLLTAVILASVLLAGPARAEDVVLAVTYFDAHSVRPEIEPAGRGVADMLMTDLQRSEGVRVVERAQLNTVLAELELQRSQFIDENTAQEVGKGLGASVVVVGAVTAILGEMRIDARVVDVASGEVLFAADAMGAEEEFFDLEQQIADQILQGLGLEEPGMVGGLGMMVDISLDDVVDRGRKLDQQDLPDFGLAPRTAAEKIERAEEEIELAHTATIRFKRRRGAGAVVLGIGGAAAAIGFITNGSTYSYGQTADTIEGFEWARKTGIAGLVVGLTGTIVGLTGFFMLVAPAPYETELAVIPGPVTTVAWRFR